MHMRLSLSTLAQRLAFVLDDVPAGRCRLCAWHERIGENATAIDVIPGGTERAAFVLPIDVH